MITRFRYYWQQLQESLWFVPGLLVVVAGVLAYVLVEFDARTSFDGAKRFPLLFGASAEGSRGMLTAIAGSMLTVAALVFSLTLSTISQVSSQYSPRVLRNFMRDRGNQVVMGYFVSVFVYCLLVLGTIRGTDEQRFVPSTAVLAGLVLALGGVVALIYFIHHIAESLQTGTILQRISQETFRAIDALFPEQVGEPVPFPEQEDHGPEFNVKAAGWQMVRSTRGGYVQSIDAKHLLDWAHTNHALLRVEQPVGAFIGEQVVMFRVRPESAELPNDGALAVAADKELPNLLMIARHRSSEQDVAFGLQQLVDIALKALSPGVNDTTTAIMAVDNLGLVFQRLASRPFPPPLRSDGHRPRLLVQAMDFAGYLQLTFDLVRINSKANHALFRRLLRALALAGDATDSVERKALIETQAEQVLRYANQTLATEYEKQAVQALHQELQPQWQPELSRQQQ